MICNVPIVSDPKSDNLRVYSFQTERGSLIVVFGSLKGIVEFQEKVGRVVTATGRQLGFIEVEANSLAHLELSLQSMDRSTNGATIVMNDWIDVDRLLSGLD